MVVPIERASSSLKSKKYVGNDQAIELVENYSTVKVIGNRCVLKIGQNEGCVKVIGDSCQVTVGNGQGSVHYVGNGGRINLGDNTDSSRVTCIGNGVTVTSRAEDEKVKTSAAEAEKRSKSPTGERTYVNLREQSCLHIGECRNIFVPLCHSHVCFKVPNVKNGKKC